MLMKTIIICINAAPLLLYRGIEAQKFGQNGTYVCIQTLFRVSVKSLYIINLVKIRESKL